MSERMRPRVRYAPSTFVAVAFIASIMSPYMALIGRGLRTSWPLFALWCVVAGLECRKTFSLTMREARRRRLELGALTGWFMVVLLNWGLDRGYTSGIHVVSSITLLMIVVMGTVYAGRQDGTYAAAVIGILAVLGIDALRSLPSLWSNFGVARVIMLVGLDPALVELAARKGVGSYALYTANAIGLPVLLAVAASSRRALRVVLIAACLSLASAIVLATFTGAFALMTGGFVLLLLLAVLRSRRRTRSLVGAAVVTCTLGAALAGMMNGTPQVDFVLQKAARLYEGVSASGLEQGDETGRAGLFAVSWRTFVAHPFVGIGPTTHGDNVALYDRVGGHSSWVDQLAEYGVFGFGFYLVFVAAGLRRVTASSLAYRRSFIGRACTVSSVLYVVGGIVNPVTFVPHVAVAFFFVVHSGPALFYGLHGGKAASDIAARSGAESRLQ